MTPALPLFDEATAPAVHRTGWMVCTMCGLRQMAMATTHTPSLRCGVCGAPATPEASHDEEHTA